MAKRRLAPTGRHRLSGFARLALRIVFVFRRCVGLMRPARSGPGAAACRLSAAR
ncbi:hypothetical protein JOS77_15260 [Chromobacterium haemolyticum]|nr:hypothetical protein JOS77_15260 [Chromobacterium haemolyticum]